MRRYDNVKWCYSRYICYRVSLCPTLGRRFGSVCAPDAAPSGQRKAHIEDSDSAISILSSDEDERGEKTKVSAHFNCYNFPLAFC